MGKGSKVRPRLVSFDDYASSFDRTFGRIELEAVAIEKDGSGSAYYMKHGKPYKMRIPHLTVIQADHIYTAEGRKSAMDYYRAFIEKHHATLGHENS